MTNIMISGVGGQGTVLASKLIAAAAMNNDLDVRTTETIGMAQRGGCVVSHVRIGSSIQSPLIPLKSADAIIGFEPAEAVRMLPYLSEDGVVIVCDTAIKPVTSSLKGGSYRADDMISFLKTNIKKLIIIDGEKLIKECGSEKTLNVALLGTALESGVFPFNVDDMAKALHETLPERFWDINIKSLDIGRRYYNESRNAQ